MEINFDPWMSRTVLLLGTEKLTILNRSHVLVAGLGGVGAYAAEQICRAGVGEMTIVDGDIVTETNKNRQLLALDSTLGQSKTEVMKQLHTRYDFDSRLWTSAIR
jgi:tRNA A37 threonylcarbamoyladenosine dehydratase